MLKIKEGELQIHKGGNSAIILCVCDKPGGHNLLLGSLGIMNDVVGRSRISQTRAPDHGQAIFGHFDPKMHENEN